MIHTKLLLLEYNTVNKTGINQWKLVTIRNIRNLLFNIDLTAEIIPANDANKLNDLLSTLKGKKLTTEEEKLVKELVVI